MNADRDIERLLDTWFAEGPMQVSDRAFDEAVGRVYRQRQRPAWRFLTWRFPAVSTSIKLALTGAALLVVLVGGAVFLGGGRPGPTPTPTPEPTLSTPPAPSPTPAPTLSPTPRPAQMDLQGDQASWTAVVPAGWTGAGTWYLTASQGPTGPTGIGVAASGAVNVPSDPCDGVGKVSDAASPADVLAELEARDDLVLSNANETTLGGYSGTRVDVEFPADLSACGEDLYIIFAEPDGSGFYAQGPSQLMRVWILDVEGRPIVFWINSFAATPASNLAEAQQIVDSIVITP